MDWLQSPSLLDLCVCVCVCMCVCVCVCCLQVTHRTADDQCFSLQLECSWLSYLSLHYDSYFHSPFPWSWFLPSHPHAISFHQPSLQALQASIPRLHNAQSLTILNEYCRNETQQVKKPWCEHLDFEDISYGCMFPLRLATTVHPGIMNHNVMLRSDWHGECHCGLVTDREAGKERGGGMVG